MSEIQGTYDAKLAVSGAVNFLLSIGESLIGVTFDVVDKQPIPVLLVSTFIDRLITTIHLLKGRMSHTTLR